jgi:hypothetical protein
VGRWGRGGSQWGPRGWGPARGGFDVGVHRGRHASWTARLLLWWGWPRRGGGPGNRAEGPSPGGCPSGLAERLVLPTCSARGVLWWWWWRAARAPAIRED